MSEPQTTPIPFVNEVRLNARQWAITVLVVALCAILLPAIWKKAEWFETGPDYRIPYPLSRDYWLYEWRLREIRDPGSIILLGDSVVWGEYVQPKGSLSHFLNAQANRQDLFVNAGLNGLFPLALEGLTKYYGGALTKRKVILHCNLLWMSSPKADLQIKKEEKFNHSRLTPQFFPRIPCYRVDANERLSVVMERNVPFLSWVGHLQNTYFGDQSIPKWTLQDDGNDPPHYPNAGKNPLAQITMSVPPEPARDPLRGPGSPRHKPWLAGGARPVQFEWVDPATSIQWAAFQRAVRQLRVSGNSIFVILGPFNEHILAPQSVPGYKRFRDAAEAWLKQEGVAFAAPEILPSELYADASHPLTPGYQLLAKEIYNDPRFKEWMR